MSPPDDTLLGQYPPHSPCVRLHRHGIPAQYPAAIDPQLPLSQQVARLVQPVHRVNPGRRQVRSLIGGRGYFRPPRGRQAPQ